MPDPTPTSSPDPRWPAIAAFATAWLCPTRSAQRTQHVTLPSAFAVHFAAAALSFLLILWLMAVDERQEFAHTVGNILRDLPPDLLGKTLVVGLFVLMIECGFPVLAFLVMPWGTSDEPLRLSWKHALRLAWLHSTHALPLILIVGGMVVLYDRLERNYYDSNPPPQYRQPQLSFNRPPWPNPATQEKMREYIQQSSERHRRAEAEARAQYLAARDAWENRNPWIAKHGQTMVMWVIAASVGWILWALLRAVGAERRLTPITHPPTCDCGYNLTGAKADGRCPECGQLVAISLGPEGRMGTQWERRREIGRLRAWWGCTVDAVRRPSAIGRQVRVCSHVTDHRVFLATQLPAAFAIGALVAIGLLLVVTFLPGGTFRQQEHELLHLLIPLGGTIGVLVVLAVTLLGAGIIGLIYTVKNKRNLLPAAMQVASYLAGYTMIWACFAGVVMPCLLAATAGRNPIFRTWAVRMGISLDVLRFVGYWVLNLPWLAVYLMALWRGTAAAQYANR